MTEALLLRFDAPLLCFGGVAVDKLGVTWRMPGRAMLTGLLGNALGYRHFEAEKLESLQRRLRYAARCDRAGREIVDFQTVDLSQQFLSEGWTTRGAPEGREGGTASEGTHIRYRHYIADAVYTVAVTLRPANEVPDLATIESALREPARPLFIGRKCCLPSSPLLLRRTQAASLLQALVADPLSSRAAAERPVPVWWPADEDTDRTHARLIPITDDRDWTNQIHVGRRWMHEGTIDV